MEQQKIIVNALPVKTWHRLDVNEAKTIAYTPTAACTVQAESEQGTTQISAVSKVEPEQSVETGVGAALTPVFQWGMQIAAASNTTDTVRMTIQNAPQAESSLQVLVNAAEGSHLTIVQNWEGQANHAAVRTILNVAADASVHLIQVLADNSADSWNDVGCVVAEKGSIELIRLYLTKGNLTSGVRADLIGDGSSFTSHSGYLVQQNRTLDMNVIVNHIGKKTMSDIIAEGTVQNHAAKVFRGTIDLRTGCSGSEGKENETVLLLGDDVVNKTIPLILCSEEDVKGSHGASIGELPQDILFYFASRGIEKEIAEKIISRAKLETLCQGLDEKTADLLQKTIDEVIPT